jgi:hypothetical protein
MTLSDILGRDVQLEFHEAIALMRAIAERSSAVPPTSAPELDQIELLADGTVELLGTTATDDPVARLIEMLQMLTGSGLKPPQLTSLMEGSHGSVEALSEALAYFERPNRSLILQDLYSRASGEPRLPAADELIASLRAAPTPEPAAKAEQRPELATRRRTIMYGAAAVAGAVVLAVLVGLLWRGTGSANADTPPTLSSRVADGVSGVAGAVGSAVKSIGQRAGIGDGPPSPAPVEAAAPPTGTGPAAAPPSARGSSKPSNSSARSGPPQTMPVPPASGVAIPGRITDRAVEASPSAPPASEPESVDDVVYAAGAPNVVPPVGIRPHVNCRAGSVPRTSPGSKSLWIPWAPSSPSNWLDRRGSTMRCC